MLLACLKIAMGLLAIAWAADRFVLAATQIAQRLGVSSLLIGLTIVALGTSAPEIFVSIQAALQGNADLATGNILGSNIANIGLVLGLTALIRPLAVHTQVLKKQYPLLFATMILVWLLLRDQYLSVVDGMVLIVGLCALMTWLFYQSKQPNAISVTHTTSPNLTLFWIVYYSVVGAALLPIGANLIVSGATTLAQLFQISDLIIGLTIVAVGTSLPEIATVTVAAIKNEHDLVIGNVLGSNMLNLLAVLPIPGLLHPHSIQAQLVQRDLSTMFAITVVSLIICYGFKGQGRISRWEGGLLLSCYIGYTLYLLSSML